MAVRAMAHSLNYRLCLESKPSNSLLGHVITDMKTLSQNGVECWISRTDRMSELLALPIIVFLKVLVTNCRSV